MAKPVVTISCDYEFCSAHWLPEVAETHRCHRLHGHTYRMTVMVGTPLRPDGFLIDFWDLDAIVKPIVELVDHRCLNDVPGLQNPTAELIALWFLEKLNPHGVVAVRIYETPTCWADAVMTD